MLLGDLRFYTSSKSQDSKVIWLVISLVLLITIVMKINTSSVAAFCELASVGCNKKEYVANDRKIRSDEWLVSSPLVISQYSSGFGNVNYLIGDGMQLGLLTSAPSYHWTTIFKPYHSLFYVLDVETAYSLANIASLIILLISAYLYFKLLNLGRFYSITLSIALFSSSFVQWWSAFTTVAYVLILICLAYSLQQHVLKRSLQIYSVIIAGCYIFSLSLLQLYPPFQVPMYWIVVFVTIPLFIPVISKLRPGYIFKILVILILAATTSGVLLISYWRSYSLAIKSISESSYPGKRKVAASDFPKFRLMSGFYDIQLLNEAKPMGPYNQSEASGFFNIFLFLLPIIVLNESIKVYKRKRLDHMAVALTLYLIFIGTWMLYGYPSWFAKITLLDRVPANRAYIGLGVGGFLLTAYYVFKYKPIFNPKWLKVSLGVISFITILCTGFYLRDAFPTYISSIPKILLISTVSCFIVFAAINQWKRSFAITLLVFSLLTAGSVHPIRSGLGPVTDSQFVQQAKEVNSTDPARWAVYNNNILSPLLYANGIQSATGVYLYPQVEWWKKFDPTEQYREIWNRYAHVYFLEPTAERSNEITFSLLQLDSFAVEIDPCNQFLDKINVKYVVSNTKLRSSCVDEVPKGNYQHGIYIYRRTGTTSQQ